MEEYPDMLKETIDFHGKQLTIETGRLAKQAHGSALITLGETVVLVTVVAGRPREGMDYLPLTVEYMERTYAAGKIPGGFFKREGRNTEIETLTSRLIDRPIRPLFPKGYHFDTQVLATVLSHDKTNDPGIAALLGASCALTFSDVPFDGPIAGLRVGARNGELLVNPTYAEREECELEVVVAVGKDGLTMVEGGAKVVPEKLLIEALLFAEKAGQPLLELQEKMAAELNITKRVIEPPAVDEALVARVREVAWEPMCKALEVAEKIPRHHAVHDVHGLAIKALAEEFEGREKEIRGIVEGLEKERLRRLILDEGKRIDGRGPDDVRPISCDTGLLPRVHGSALFTRGETQAIVAATLGTSADEQRMDLLTGDITRHFILHYNFPPYSVGEVKMIRGPSRRDIGHGNLAHRGVSAVLPEIGEDFPYTLRVVSEILESNGSSSMATVCGSSMALMDAGVPTKCHVGGIAMGLVKEGDNVVVLTDILGDEDHSGDMDFKVVGTEEGVSAVQMDIKCSGLNEAIFTKALEQARQARLHIIGKMKEAIDKPRENYSAFAPRILSVHINPDRIRDLIGPGGRNIRGVQAESGAKIEVNDEGVVMIATPDQEVADKAIAMVKALTDEAEVGKTYTGQVVKTTDFGAFVRILPGVEGLVHISELANHRVRSVEDVVREGDEVVVKCISIDTRSGKVRLSRREALTDSGEEGGDRGREHDHDRVRDRERGRDDNRRRDR